MQIGHHQIGGNNTVYIVAELSANHKQDFGRALRILQAAKAAGADAIKLQTYTPDSITLDSDRECFRIHGGTLWDGQTLHSLYAEASTPWEWHAKLQSAATDLALDFFSSPFDASAIGFLETLNVPAYKIASPELVDIGLIERAARTGKPLIMSTGMATREEIQEALETARRSGTKEIALLRCTSAYPAPVEEMNLRAIPEMADAFGLPVGLSDHTTGIAAPVAAVALGACIIEKHLTLARSDGGPDAAFSLEPDEFRTMVEAVRVAEKVLGSAYIGPQPRENASRAFRRSLFVVENMKSGTLFNSTNVRSIRPAHGLHPRYLPQVLGKSCTRDITRGTPLDWDLVKTNN